MTNGSFAFRSKVKAPTGYTLFPNTKRKSTGAVPAPDGNVTGNVNTLPPSAYPATKNPMTLT
ncbi:MAG: hypothetical protein BGO52_00415 [Sphingobacteriales bacterium 44-61]|nr:MAG: hypothetical protein BGO52_00415 [Sphingobacteriales bacterium 44-61]